MTGGDPVGNEAGWQLACPACRRPLGRLPGPEDAAPLRCSRSLLQEGVGLAPTPSGCGAEYPCEEGIWRFLAPERADFYAAFLADYERIRREEGRGSDDPAYYLDLPDCPPEHPIAWQWRLRRATYRCLMRRVLPRLDRPAGAGARQRVLDLGAGVGWLCHRMALAGYRPAAVDLTVDSHDGLAAARHYLGREPMPYPPWPRLQAEFDRLPLADGSVGLVIFNASLHYSTDYRRTLGEALRTLAPGGHLLILESPIYRRKESGRRMVAERHAAFERRFGTRSDSLPSIEYLTRDRLAALEDDLGLRFRRFVPWYGWRWAWRPWKARLTGGREPSRFAILAARKQRG